MAGEQLGDAAGAGDLEASEHVLVIVLGPLPIEGSRIAGRAEGASALKAGGGLLVVVLAGHARHSILATHLGFDFSKTEGFPPLMAGLDPAIQSLLGTSLDGRLGGRP